MPKSTSVTALKRARRLLKPVQFEIADSSAESEAESEKSAEFSHVPVEIVPDLQHLFLEEKDHSNISMEEIANEVGVLTRLLEDMRRQQEQQQTIIDTLSRSQRQASGVNGNIQQANTSVEALFKIPDPIKSIPRFDGNRKQLSAWLTTAENTLSVFKDLVPVNQYEIFVTAVINKIEGKAKDIICLAGNPQKFDEVKEILTNALGDRQELTFYKSQLWQTKMTDNMSVHKYYAKCKETCQNIKSLAKQKQKYKDHWEAINAFIEEDALAAFLSGLKEPYFGYAQAARPEDMEAAYAFVCKFKCKEQASSSLDASNRKSKDFKTYDKNSKKPYFDKNKSEKAELPKDATEPMEVGSTKSKLTLNKRQVHNNEVVDSDKNSGSESENESENENIDINFCWAQQRQETT